MDYVESVWESLADDCMHQCELGQQVAQNIISHLNSMAAMCNNLKSVPDRYEDLERIDLDVVAATFRDAFGSGIMKVLRTLTEANDQMHDVFPVIQSVVH